MPAELPYLSSYKNVGLLFEKIRTAKVPDAVTTRYLAETFGLKSNSDRSLIALLKTLGFLDTAGHPTTAYSLLKNEKTARLAIAAALKTAYEPLFASNERVYDLPADQIKGLVAQVSGADEGTTAKIVGTFRAICGVADFTSQPDISGDKVDEPEHNDKDAGDDSRDKGEKKTGSLRPEFHYNIQIHLPSNGTEETYINIFNAIRSAFK